MDSAHQPRRRRWVGHLGGRRPLSSWAALLLLGVLPSACGRVGFDPAADARPGDTGTFDSSRVDSAIADTGAPDTGGAADSGALDTGPGDAGACAVDPCRLVSPQCGCAAGTMCAWPNQAGPRSCLPTGGSPVGAACAREAECDAEGGCLLTGPGAGQCVTYCTETAGCPVTAECVDFGWPETIGFCSRLCDPETGGGCPPSMACGVSTAFRVEDDAERIVSFCSAPGTGVQGDACAGYWECQGGFACVGYCAQVCVRATPSCPGDCMPFVPVGIIGGVEYGFCRSGGTA